MPPTRNEGGEAMEVKIVSELSKEFNVDEVYGTESSYIGSLKSVIEFNPVEVPPSDPLAFDESMLEDEKQPERENPLEISMNENEAMAEDTQETDVKKTSSQQKKKIKKAEKKRRGKTKTSTAMDEDESKEGDYDFKVDYVKKRSAMYVGEEEEEEDDDDGLVDENGNDKSESPKTTVGVDQSEATK